MKYSDDNVKQLINRFLEGSLTQEEFAHIYSNLKKYEEMEEFDEIASQEWEKILNKAEEKTVVDEYSLMNEAKEIINNHSRKKKKVGIKNQKRRMAFQWIGIAACFILVLTIAGVCFDPFQKPLIMNTTYTKAGEMLSIKLSDESNVALNASSSITAPVEFDKKERKVSLTGEAFFNVTHNEKKPFLIDAGDIMVKVLGTSFDVKNYKDDDNIYVSVATGTVKVWDKNCNVIILKKNEELAINKKDGLFQKLRANANIIGAWRKGILTFNRTPLPEVINIIKRYYAVNIELSNTNSNYQITGEHDNKSLDAILESVCFSTNLKFKKDKGKITIFQ